VSAGDNLAPMRPRPRLVVALAVASLLFVFLVYNAFAGSSSELFVSVGQLRANVDGSASKTVSLTGKVVSHGPTGRGPLTMVLRDDASAETMRVRYRGDVPSTFREGRSVIVRGRLEGGVFVAERDSLVAKCPSKYSGSDGGEAV
jgi:cytochrome c-type biogenesis protein CcmE